MANSTSPVGNRALLHLEDEGVDKPETAAAAAEVQEIPKKQEGGGQVPQCELKIQVLDDTALIEPSAPGNVNLKEVKVEKKHKRRVRKSRKKKEVVEKGGEKKGKESSPVVMYSRKDMEAMRFENLEGQKKKWIEVYCALGPMVSEEYDDLLDSANDYQKNCVPNLNFDPRPPIQKSANLFAVAAMVKANPLIITAH